MILLFTAMKVSNKKHSFKGEDTFVKENCILSCERVTVFSQLFSQENIKLDPEAVFKGKGTWTKVAVADSVNYQWSVSEFLSFGANA